MAFASSKVCENKPTDQKVHLLTVALVTLLAFPTSSTFKQLGTTMAAMGHLSKRIFWAVCIVAPLFSIAASAAFLGVNGFDVGIVITTAMSSSVLDWAGVRNVHSIVYYLLGVMLVRDADKVPRKVLVRRDHDAAVLWKALRSGANRTGAEAHDASSTNADRGSIRTPAAVSAGGQAQARSQSQGAASRLIGIAAAGSQTYLRISVMETIGTPYSGAPLAVSIVVGGTMKSGHPAPHTRAMVPSRQQEPGGLPFDALWGGEAMDFCINVDKMSSLQVIATLSNAASGVQVAKGGVWAASCVDPSGAVTETDIPLASGAGNAGKLRVQMQVVRG